MSLNIHVYYLYMYTCSREIMIGCKVNTFYVLFRVAFQFRRHRRLGQMAPSYWHRHVLFAACVYIACIQRGVYIL